MHCIRTVTDTIWTKMQNNTHCVCIDENICVLARARERQIDRECAHLIMHSNRPSQFLDFIFRSLAQFVRLLAENTIFILMHAHTHTHIASIHIYVMWPLILMSNDAFNALHFHYNRIASFSSIEFSRSLPITHTMCCDLIQKKLLIDHLKCFFLFHHLFIRIYSSVLLFIYIRMSSRAWCQIKFITW